MLKKLGRFLVSYLLLLSAAVLVVFFTVQKGSFFNQSHHFVPPHAATGSFWEQLQTIFMEGIRHPLPILIIQIITIIFTARFLGLLFSRLGQPMVIGEILAGILLGPSLVGTQFPEISAFLFPSSSLGNLQFLSQIGLILFMFVIGVELDISVLKARARDAILVSHAGILTAFSTGVVTAYFTYETFAPMGVRFVAYALFMGISMSITAFPVLARIIQERGWTRTRLGSFALTSAAVDDITAWCLLAVVITVAKAGSFTSALFTIGSSVVYVLFMLLILRPFLNRLGTIYTNRESISRGVMALVLLILMCSAWATEVIGIHALFGAFLAGVVMPPSASFRRILIEKLEDVSVILLLPLFFVYTGLRTQIGLLNEGSLWEMAGIIILVASAAKIVSVSLSSKLLGQSWKESLSMGALMNTRGLMELIVLNIGYDLGILSPEMFAMLVLMAVVTTFGTGPMLNLIGFVDRIRKKKEPQTTVKAELHPAYRILISFGLSTSGRKLLRLAHQMLGNDASKVEYTAIHVTNTSDVSMLNLEDFEHQSFKPIRSEAEKLKIKLDTRYNVASELFREVNGVAQKEQVNLLLLGAGRSLYTGSLLGNLMGVTKALYPENLLDTLTGQRPLLPTNDLIDERARDFLLETPCDVGVLLDRDFSDTDRIFLPLFTEDDAFLLDYATRFVKNHGSQVQIADTLDVLNKQSELSAKFQSVCNQCEGKIGKLPDRIIHKDFLDKQELMLISYKSWKALVESKSVWLDHVPSVLIIRQALQTH